MLHTALLLILELVTPTLPDGVVGKSYQARLIARGGKPPYTWALGDTPLPRGLTLNSVTGVISGVPRVGDADPQGSRFTVVGKDSSVPTQTATFNLTLRVAQPITTLTRSLPQARAGEPYKVQLQIRGGRPPLRWEVLGTLPPELSLNAETGLISGTPAQGGDYDFAIRVSDDGVPRQVETFNFNFRARAPAPLVLRWKTPPNAEKEGIFGSLEAANGTCDEFNLTVIVVAVNEYGKAFTLGHHQIRLTGGTVTGELPFGFSLPRGSYSVHADGAAEVPPTTIYRARLELPSLQVGEPRIGAGEPRSTVRLPD